MKAFFRFVARFLAVVSAIFFVITAVTAIILFNLEGRLFDPDTYKSALEEERIYERLPAIVSQEITLSMNYNPCEASPMVCGIEGASAEYLACLADALGQEALEEIGSGKRLPTEAEKILAQPCRIDMGSRSPRIIRSREARRSSLKTSRPMIGNSSWRSCCRRMT